jgi:hypothetical protein
MPKSKWVDNLGPLLDINPDDSWEEVERFLTEDMAVGLPQRRVWRVRSQKLFPNCPVVAVTREELYSHMNS